MTRDEIMDLVDNAVCELLKRGYTEERAMQAVKYCITALKQCGKNETRIKLAILKLKIGGFG